MQRADGAQTENGNRRQDFALGKLAGIRSFSPDERISKIIKELDRGDGASIDDVMRLSKVSNGEEIISDMMMRGEIYEAKAGYIKLM